MEEPKHNDIQYFIYHIYIICRQLFDISETQIVGKALDCLDITSINYRDDNEMERLISKIIAVDCIIHGPCQLSEENTEYIKNKINIIYQLLPKTGIINDYPKVIQFRSMLEKMRDDFEEAKTTFHINKVIGVDDN